MKLTRRVSALKRLELQLASGVKPFILRKHIKDLPMDNTPIPKTLPLTMHDIVRMKKEIGTLKERV